MNIDSDVKGLAITALDGGGLVELAKGAFCQFTRLGIGLYRLQCDYQFHQGTGTIECGPQPINPGGDTAPVQVTPEMVDGYTWLIHTTVDSLTAERAFWWRYVAAPSA